ncbi:PREDICTED: uncharacterized protein LOC109148674 [Ipomoea nil]|uniref:uncharacterized protein LOC109148674 n=1 Tax=Ipomoea nil TaxID=35883 RepID=UPI0009009ED2|nr:PREDICTED: uncharacterized protein LOC109148674 [Ipomoea nil]
MILDHYVIVQQWTPNFIPSKNRVQKILAWVRLSSIPVEYFDEVYLWKLGEQIGKPIKIDTTTSLASRGKFARICVEIDISKPLLAKFWIEQEVCPIEYVGIHLVCFGCGRYGHKKEQCGEGIGKKVREESGQEVDMREVASEETQFHEPALMEKTISRDQCKSEKYGSWMLVTRKERRSNRRNGNRGKQGSKVTESVP